MITTISITDLKQDTARVIKRVTSEGKPVIVMQRSKVAAVLLDPEYFQSLELALENAQDVQAIKDREHEATISFEDVAKKLGTS